MKIRSTAVAGLILSLGAAALSAAPAAARGLAETHSEVHQPGGKSPTKLYRQVARDACAVAARHHPAGKLPKAHAPAAASGCDDQVAQAKRTGKSATASAY